MAAVDCHEFLNKPSKPLILINESLPPPSKSTIDHVLPLLEVLELHVPQKDGVRSSPQTQSLMV